jgi:hypothetical protein
MREEERRDIGDSVWPGGAPYAHCLTHDVDRVQKQLYHYFFYAARGESAAYSPKRVR